MVLGEENLHSTDDGEGSSDLLMHHKSEDSQLGGTSVVQLNSTLLELGLLVEGVPAEVNVVITEVSDEFSSGDVLHDSKLKESNEGIMIWARPAAGMASGPEMAAHPLGYESKE